MLTFRLPFNTSFFGTIYYDQMFREACSSIYKLINYTVLTHINTHLSLFKISSVLIFEDVHAENKQRFKTIIILVGIN